MTDNTPPVFAPVYRAAPIATCPECCGDLQHEGIDGYWCSACQRAFHFAEVAFFEDNERDDDF